MNKNGITRLIILPLLILADSISAETPNDAQGFDYKTTVSIIQYTHEGSAGYIYARFPGFIHTAQIIIKYAEHFSDETPGLIPLDVSSLPVKVKLKLINPVAQQEVVIGDHWIGDGNKFVIMEDRDFRHLISLLKSRVNASMPEENKRLDSWIEHVHRHWLEDKPEDFQAKFPYAIGRAPEVTSNTNNTDNGDPPSQPNKIDLRSTSLASDNKEVTVSKKDPRKTPNSSTEVEPKIEVKLDTAAQSPQAGSIATPAPETQALSIQQKPVHKFPWMYIITLGLIGLGSWRLFSGGRKTQN